MLRVVHVGREAVSVVMHTAIQLSVGGEHAGLQHVAERVDVQGPFGSVRLYYKTFSFLFYFESVPAGILPS